MSKVIMVCGTIGSGKTSYCSEIKEKYNAVLLSVDEIMYDIYHHREGEEHDKVVLDIKNYLKKKSVEIVNSGTNVLLDWGFWTRKEREEVREFYASHQIECEWHNIEISKEDWMRNIVERNQKVLAGKSTDYYVDEGLLEKVNGLYEVPDKEEIDYWHVFVRK